SWRGWWQRRKPPATNCWWRPRLARTRRPCRRRRASALLNWESTGRARTPDLRRAGAHGFEPMVADAKRAQMRDGVGDIFHIGAGLAGGAGNPHGRIRDVEPSGILRVA